MGEFFGWILLGIFWVNFLGEFQGWIFWANFLVNFFSEFFWEFLDELFGWNFSLNFVGEFFEEFFGNFLTYNLLTIASFRIGVPSILFFAKTKIQIDIISLDAKNAFKLYLWKNKIEGTPILKLAMVKRL